MFLFVAGAAFSCSDRDVKFRDIIIRKAFRLEEESLGCLVERDGYIAIAAQVKVSLIIAPHALFNSPVEK